ncbi:MAG: 3-oxoacyl-ACP reductase family protein [Thermotogota bacterium]
MTKNDRKPGALVTGSSRGIGAAIARRLAELGYGVCINYMASEAAARDQVRTIEAKGGRAIAVRADVALFSDVEHMVQKTAETFGGIRVVVNNAGLSEHTTVEGLTVEAWNRAVAVNLSSAFYAVKAALPYLRSEPWGRIVNICSLRAMTGSDHGAHYAAAKAGLIGLTKSLALELAPAITVNAVSPGYTRTDMTQDSLTRHGEAILSRIPAHRAAEPEEIAALVGFLASEDAAYITGETVNANGGIYMR